jgi:site-specific DNA-methyltransferase (adenine-specific)
MGRAWDDDKGGRLQWIAYMVKRFRAVYRVLKPGAHGLVWAIPRTSHWTATALEEAGFEVRDVITHLFGQGFPKSKNLGKESNAWDGWGTALKPASEHWILVRKPVEGTVVGNVLKYGTGAIHIEAGRIRTAENLNGGAYSGGERPRSAMGMTGEAGGTSSMLEEGGGRLPPEAFKPPSGRWPANVTLEHSPGCEFVGAAEGKGYSINSFKDGMKPFGNGAGHAYTSDTVPEIVEKWSCEVDCPVRLLDEQSGERPVSGSAKLGKPSRQTVNSSASYSGFAGTAVTPLIADSGGASRFFYTAKASRREKNEGLDQENTHPTVKPLALMQYLLKLISTPGAYVLDPFMGSGSTGVAAMSLGLNFLGVEGDPEYAATARKRLAHAWRKTVEKPQKAAEKSPIWDDLCS